MNFELTQLPVADIQGDLEVIIVINNNTDHVFVQDKKLLKKAGFEGGQDETCLLVSQDRLYVGADSTLGKDIRTASANAIKALKGKGYKSIKVGTYLHSSNCTNSLRAMVEGFILGAYTFEKYKTKKDKNKIKHISISLDEYNGYKVDIEKASSVIHKAQIVADATNFTRDIVNTTPDDCYPEVMADIAESLANETGLKCKVLKPKELKQEKMETLLAVAQSKPSQT